MREGMASKVWFALCKARLIWAFSLDNQKSSNQGTLLYKGRACQALSRLRFCWIELGFGLQKNRACSTFTWVTEENQFKDPLTFCQVGSNRPEKVQTRKFSNFQIFFFFALKKFRYFFLFRKRRILVSFESINFLRSTIFKHRLAKLDRFVPMPRKVRGKPNGLGYFFLLWRTAPDLRLVHWNYDRAHVCRIDS